MTICHVFLTFHEISINVRARLRIPR